MIEVELRMWLEMDKASGLVTVHWNGGAGPGGTFGPKPWARAIEFARWGLGEGVHQVEMRVLGPVRLPNSRVMRPGVVNWYRMQLRGRS